MDSISLYPHIEDYRGLALPSKEIPVKVHKSLCEEFTQIALRKTESTSEKGLIKVNIKNKQQQYHHRKPSLAINPASHNSRLL